MAALTPPWAPPQPPVENLPVVPGLTTVAPIRSFPNEHMAAGGIQYLPDTCGGYHLYPAECPDDPPDKVFDSTADRITGKPTIGYATFVCGSITFNTAEFERRIRLQFEYNEPSIVENVFWGDASGDVIGWLQDTDNDVTMLTDGTDLVQALSALEQAYGDCTRFPGIIHATPAAAAYFSENHLLFPTSKDGIMRTLNNNWVVFGRGYSGLGRAGEVPDPGEGYLYITRVPRIWAAVDIEIDANRQVMDRTRNQQYALAEREYVIAVDCCAFGISTPWRAA